MNDENIRQLITMWNLEPSDNPQLQLQIMLLKCRILMFQLGLTFTDGKYRCNPENILPEHREEFITALQKINSPPIAFTE